MTSFHNLASYIAFAPARRLDVAIAFFLICYCEMFCVFLEKLFFDKHGIIKF
jgi:hypothetical protein